MTTIESREFLIRRGIEPVTVVRDMSDTDCIQLAHHWETRLRPSNLGTLTLEDIHGQPNIEDK